MEKTIWQLDPTHTNVGFTVRHMVVAKVHGRFTGFAGKLTLGEDGSLIDASAEIEAESIDTQVEARDKHLRSADFFDVESHPKLRFQSSKVEKVGEDRYRVTGTLEIRGVAKEVVLDTEYLGRAKDPFGVERIAFSAKTSIDRRDFGLTWNQAMETGGILVGERVDIGLEIQAVPETVAEAA